MRQPGVPVVADFVPRPYVSGEQILCHRDETKRSPDGAKRNPGMKATLTPDCAEPVIGRAFARPVGSIRATFE
jgi:hypothetical protein